MKLFHFTSSLWLPRPITAIFDFFSDAQNLEDLTPPSLRFQILTPAPIQMRQGALIDYRLKIRGVPVRWRTRITVWEPPHRFVDEQLRGPYRVWIHEHRFHELDGGTTCEDSVQYHPFGGTLINSLFVERDIRKIFAYRSDRLRLLFP